MATPPTFTSGQVLTAAQMNKVGLWLITSGTVSAQATTTVSNCFTSDYENYKIVVYNGTVATGNPAVQFQLSLAGTPSATGYFYGGYFMTHSAASSGGVTSGGAGTTTANFGTWGTTPKCSTTMELQNPQAAVQTTWQTTSSNFDAWVSTAGYHSANTAYDGFKLLNSGASNMTFSYAVYGYRR